MERVGHSGGFSELKQLELKKSALEGRIQKLNTRMKGENLIRKVSTSVQRFFAPVNLHFTNAALTSLKKGFVKKKQEGISEIKSHYKNIAKTFEKEIVQKKGFGQRVCNEIKPILKALNLEIDTIESKEDIKKIQNFVKQINRITLAYAKGLKQKATEPLKKPSAPRSPKSSLSKPSLRKGKNISAVSKTNGQAPSVGSKVSMVEVNKILKTVVEFKKLKEKGKFGKAINDKLRPIFKQIKSTTKKIIKDTDLSKSIDVDKSDYNKLIEYRKNLAEIIVPIVKKK